MRVAVLSGKGGIGKTFVSTNLAASTRGSVYVDCDVEEPNGRLFLPCESAASKEVCIALPTFDPQSCTGCRACVDFCQFNALAFIGKTPRLFREVCHSCGGCRLICAVHAVGEQSVSVGSVEVGVSHGVQVVTGEMNVGEASGVPVICAALAEALRLHSELTVIDCPPGSACTVTESISAADYCLVVAEPTVFGVHDLGMVLRLIQTVGKPCGVVINKCNGAFPATELLCREHGVPILARIPYQKELAACISAGRLAVEESEEIWRIFTALKERIGGAV